MAKGKGKRYHKPKFSVTSAIPVAVLGYIGYTGYTKDGAKGAVGAVVNATTGYSLYANKFIVSEDTIGFYGSVVGSYIGKKLVNMTGVNRAMKGLPFRL